MKNRYYSIQEKPTLSYEQSESLSKESPTNDAHKKVHFKPQVEIASIPNDKTSKKTPTTEFLSPDSEAKQTEVSWPKGTTLLTGDSMIGGIFEKWIGKTKMMKVRSFPGATTDDMIHYLRPLLRRRPSRVVLHVGTNDTSAHNSKEIVNKLIRLRTFIQSQISDCSVILSTPINRFDSEKQGRIVRNINVILKNMSDIELIDNGNISEKHLGKNKLHLNQQGSTVLIRNILRSLKNI